MEMLWRESCEDYQLAAVVRAGGLGPGTSGIRLASVGLPRPPHASPARKDPLETRMFSLPGESNKLS